MEKFIKIILNNYFIALAGLFFAILLIPLYLGTNTGQDVCEYTTPENANWHFIGETCQLTDLGIWLIFFGGFVTFSLFFFFAFMFKIFLLNLSKGINYLCKKYL